jgi:hypothetical protein
MKNNLKDFGSKYDINRIAQNPEIFSLFQFIYMTSA